MTKEADKSHGADDSTRSQKPSDRLKHQGLMQGSRNVEDALSGSLRINKTKKPTLPASS